MERSQHTNNTVWKRLVLIANLEEFRSSVEEVVAGMLETAQKERWSLKMWLNYCDLVNNFNRWKSCFLWLSKERSFLRWWRCSEDCWNENKGFRILYISSVQFSSVAQSCLTLCDPMNRSMPGLLVHHQLPEFTQTHVHQVGDAIQPSHPLSSPSPSVPNPSQHQSLFQWVNSSHEVAKVLEFQLYTWLIKQWQGLRGQTPIFKVLL